MQTHLEEAAAIVSARLQPQNMHLEEAEGKAPDDPGGVIVGLQRQSAQQAGTYRDMLQRIAVEEFERDKASQLLMVIMQWKETQMASMSEALRAQSHMG